MKKVVKLSFILSCLFIFSGCGNRNEESKGSEKSSLTTEKIVKKKSTKMKTALSTEASINESETTMQSVEPSQTAPVEAIISSAPQEVTTPEEDPRIGQVVTSPHGHQSTVLRILPNGERVISEQTSQADYNNDGILTFEELSRAENELTQQAEQQRQSQQANQNQTVLITETGNKYHSRECGSGTFSQTTLEQAQTMGLTPCEKCY